MHECTRQDFWFSDPAWRSLVVAPEQVQLIQDSREVFGLAYLPGRDAEPSARSMPTASPVVPMRSMAGKRTAPRPVATSSTRCPGSIPTTSTRRCPKWANNPCGSKSAALLLKLAAASVLRIRASSPMVDPPEAKSEATSAPSGGEGVLA